MTGLAYGPEFDQDDDRVIVKLSLVPESLEELRAGLLCYRACLVKHPSDPGGTYRFEALVPSDDWGEALLRIVCDQHENDLAEPSPDVAEKIARWERFWDGEVAMTEKQAWRLREILRGVGLSASQADQVIARMDEAPGCTLVEELPTETKEP